MADSNRPDLPDNDNLPEAGQRAEFKSASWIDGLPHNFDGWGPKTADAEALEDATETHPELTWAGETDGRHYVWTFQRARPRHH